MIECKQIVADFVNGLDIESEDKTQIIYKTIHNIHQVRHTYDHRHSMYKWIFQLSTKEINHYLFSSTKTHHIKEVSTKTDPKKTASITHASTPKRGSLPSTIPSHETTSYHPQGVTGTSVDHQAQPKSIPNPIRVFETMVRQRVQIKEVTMSHFETITHYAEKHEELKNERS